MQKPLNLKTMKNLIKLLLLAFTAISAPMIVLADDENNDNLKRTTRLEKQIITQAPRSLCPIYIDCFYTQDYIELSFPLDFDFIEISIEDENSIVWSGYVTADIPYCNIPHCVGEYLITCTTETGVIYQGVLYF